MRKIDYIVFHCTSTEVTATVRGVLNYWKNVKKWRSPGYHYLIEHDGTINKLLPLDKVSNGARGYNSNGIHISYIGGEDAYGNRADTRSKEQEISQLKILAELRAKFPDAKVLGHRDLPGVSKTCPEFDVKKWLMV